jgi:hypothetical protein
MSTDDPIDHTASGKIILQAKQIDPTRLIIINLQALLITNINLFLQLQFYQK